MQMENSTWIGKKGFLYWYYRYRDSQYYMFAIIGLIAVICIYLTFGIIIPELTNWFSIRDEVNTTQAQIAVLQQNISFINSLNKNTLNDQLQAVSDALPPEKNFGLMLQAISIAAQTSGVSVGDYSFQVGNVGSKAAKGAPVASGPNGVSSVPLTVVVTGSLDGIIRFVKSLETTLPLSEVTRVNGSGQTVSITLQFYNGAFPAVKYAADTQLSPLSSVKVHQIQQLSQWDHSTTPQTQIFNSSGSAVPLF